MALDTKFPGHFSNDSLTKARKHILRRSDADFGGVANNRICLP
jgi:hypothetical protein